MEKNVALGTARTYTSCTSYLMTVACQFGMYWYARLPFGATLVDDIFQYK